MKYIFAILFSSILVLPIIAQDANDVVSFSADNMVIDENLRTTELQGNAVLTRNTLSMKADVIIIHTKVVGEEEAFDFMEGIGNINAKSGDQTITADHLIYTSDDETAIFTGNVEVKKGQNIANANKAVLDAATGVYTLTGPVKGVITGSLP